MIGIAEGNEAGSGAEEGEDEAIPPEKRSQMNER